MSEQNYRAFWDEALHQIHEEYKSNGQEDDFKIWFKMEYVRDSLTEITVSVPSEFMWTQMVSKKFVDTVQDKIEELTGQKISLNHIIAEKNTAKPAAAQPQEEHTDSAVEASKKIPVQESDTKKAQGSSKSGKKHPSLNEDYTFDTFVPGENSQFAYSVCIAASKEPGTKYNPFLIYGGVGLGKTHLMNSIAHFIIEHNPSAKILYVTSEEFTNEVIDAIRTGTVAINKLREKYRNIDVLLIDDIQFIIGKESTQEEFFHTFNTLHSAGKQIVLSSDRPPKDMNILEERIRSRFEWGLMADIQIPVYETRMAILKKKEEEDGYTINNDVLEYIAANVKSNIRELEGSLNRVIAMANLENKEITLDLAKQVLADLISPNDQKSLTPDYIIDVVAEQFDLTPEEIKSQDKSRKVAFPRQIVMYLCRTLLNYKQQAIADAVGIKNHTTIMYGIEKIEKEYKNNPDTKEVVDLLKKKLNPPS